MIKTNVFKIYINSYTIVLEISTGNMIPNPHDRRVGIYNSIIFCMNIYSFDNNEDKIINKIRKAFLFFLFFFRKDRAQKIAEKIMCQTKSVAKYR